MDYLFVLLSSHFQQRRAVPDVLLYPYYPHHLANLSRFKRSRVKFTAWCNQDALATSIFPTFLTSSYPSFSGLGVKLLVFFNSGDICCDICFAVFVISISRRFIPLVELSFATFSRYECRTKAYENHSTMGFRINGYFEKPFSKNSVDSPVENDRSLR